MFTSKRPEILGANLATATLSDLFAAGALPEFFIQGLTIPQECDETFVQQLTEGIRGVLSEVGCSQCGGDLGAAEKWRFSGFAMGRVMDNRPLSRRIPRKPHSLWVTGRFGDANLSALQGKPTPVFEVRHREAQFIHRWGTACMDTSGGLMDTLWWFHRLNPDMRFEIDVDLVPLAMGVTEAVATGIPAEAFLLGGAGEYELAFSIPEPAETEAVEALKEMRATRIGEASLNSDGGLFFRKKGRIVSRMINEPPCPREAVNRDAYIQTVLSMARELSGE
jgi:thiamine monophosphate kinase